MFFCNSGTEAVEACLKFARRYWYTQGVDRAHRVRRRRRRVLRPHVRRALGHARPALPRAVCAAPRAGDLRRSAEAGRARGSGQRPHGGDHRRADSGRGRHPPDVARSLRAAINDVCRRTGTLLIADEVQTGLGRTGHPFYSPVLGLRPDLISVGKALGSGVPVGAALVSEARRLSDLARRSRQHLRRQPARLPRGRLFPRTADGQGPARSRERRSARISSGGCARWR